MFRISALNEEKEQVAEETDENIAKGTKEAQEAQAFNLYNEALCLQQNNRHEDAVKVYEQLLQTSLVLESASTLVNEHNEAIEHPLKDPGLILKYSTHKNVANICAGKGDVNTAMEHYLQAVMLDTSDVTLWYKIGVLAAQLSNLHLSRHAFTQGLGCNPKHWPCLDSLVTVLYAMLDYEYCLYWISKAFQLDPCFKKGIVLRRKIISECPHLRRDTEHLFTNLDSVVFEMEIEETEGDEFIKEALTLRENRRKLREKPEIPPIPLTVPLVSFTWMSLGKSLIATFKDVKEQPLPIDDLCRIDIDILDKVNEPQKDKATADVDTQNIAGTSSNTPTDSYVSKPMNPDNPNIPVSGSSSSVQGPAESTDNGGVLVSHSMQKSTSECCDITGAGPEPNEDGNVLSNDAENQTQDSTIVGSDTPNSHKKALKRKRISQEKVIEQEQQQQRKRRSSRMRKAPSRVQPETDQPDTELDFRQSLLQLLPKTLLPEPCIASELDSDTNSQDSTLLTQTTESMDHTPQSLSVTSSQDTIKTVQPQIPQGATAQVSNTAMPSSMSVPSPAPMDLDPTSTTTAAETTAAVQSSAITENQSEKPIPDSNAAMNVSITEKEPVVASKEFTAEEAEVRSFIEKNMKNCGALDLLHEFCYELATKVDVKWGEGVREHFVSAYRLSRGALILQQFSNDDINNKDKRLYANYILSFLECWLDSQARKYDDESTYQVTPRDGEDMFFLAGAATNPDIFDEDERAFYKWQNFILRYHWMKTQYWTMQGLKDHALRELKQCEDWCSRGRDEDRNVSVSLPNLKHYSLITEETIQARVATLERMQTVKDVEAMFEENCHSEIVSLIEPMLGISPVNGDSSDDMKHSKVCERPQLLKYFLQSAVKIEDPERSFRCLVAVLHVTASSAIEVVESSKVYRYKEGKKKESKKASQHWHYLMSAACRHLDEIFEKNVAEVLSKAPKYLMVKLTGALLNVIHIGMNRLQQQGNTSTLSGSLSKIQPGSIKTENLLSQSLLPWMLLFKILKYEEQKGFAYGKGHDESTDDSMPGSIKLLLTAHDWLGDRGICCMDGGKFLRLIVKNILPRLKQNGGEVEHMISDVTTTGVPLSKESVDGDLKKVLKDEVEQCFFCMFSYPNKIQKSSHLIDHNSHQTQMTWSDAGEIFLYVRPNVLPGFDSYKVNTMLGELAALLVKIIKLLPEDVSSSIKRSLEVLGHFIKEGKLDAVLHLPPVCGEDDMSVLKNIFYLLADYNFKNKEMFIAARYYMYDLCLNPSRFDSWAGLALAESSQVDDRLRFCVTKPYDKDMGDTLEIAKNALFCFEKAVTLDKSNATLWIEFGSLAYWVHSNYSREIKMKNGADDELLAFGKEKDAMLDLAQQCFNSALSIDVEDMNNEEWLIQYMLGKIFEKKRASPQEYLGHYNRSAMLLHRKHAKYPKKIQFKSYQSDYAIEALELHFRSHASILKLVQREINQLDGFETHPGTALLDAKDYDLFDELIEEASDNNFARREVLPLSQIEEKPDCQIGKHASPSKLATVPPNTLTSLTMGCLIPDSVASALSAQLTVESDQPTNQSENSNVEDVSMDAEDLTPKASDNRECESNIPMSTDQHDGATEVKKAPEEVPDRQKRPLTDEKRRQRASSVIKSCVKALHLCLQRFPIHYKSMYRLAYLYTHCKLDTRHLLWARDILLNSETPWSQLSHMPAQGLLTERNKTNLFNGVWKIPVDEIDRPGSFGWHLYRCVLLLLDVLMQLHDHSKLLYLHNMLNKNPDQGKKYLRDVDRIEASKLALSYSIKALHAKVLSAESAKDKSSVEVKGDDDKLSSEVKGHSVDPSGEKDGHLSNLLDAYKLFQLQSKTVPGPVSPIMEPHKELLIEAFQKYLTSKQAVIAPHVPPLSFDGSDRLLDLEKAVKFCQRYSTQLKTSTSGSVTPVKMETDSKSSSKKYDPNADKEKKPDSSPLNNSGSIPQKNQQNEGAFSASDVGMDTHTKVAECFVEEKLEACNIGAESHPSTESNSDGKTSEGPPTSEGTGQVVMVKKGSQMYTKITPVHRSLAQSPGSAFTPLHTIKGSDPAKQSPDFSAKVHKDPSLQHLIRAGVGRSDHGKAPLLRSASMPVCVEDEKEVRKVEEGVFRHRVLQRAGSISDYTKEKLKSSILMKTSASLVKKPSITDFELRQLQADLDSSQSEDEEDETEEEVEKLFKPLLSENIPPSGSGISSTWEKNVVQASPSPVITAHAANATLAVTTT